MSIYRTFLEEDLELGGVLDDDNSIELQQIEDVVNDQDANAFEQDEAQAAEFGTSYGEEEVADPEEIVDESFMAIAEAEINFNKIMMAIGVHEISEAAAGREVVYEAVDVKGLFARAKKWVVDFFTKVWQTLKRFGANIAAAFKTNKQLADKYGDRIKSGYGSYSKDGKKMKMWDFPNLDTALAGNKDNAFSNAGVTKIMDRAKGSGDSSTISVDMVDSTVKDYRKTLCGEACDASDLREKMHDYIYGKEKKEGYMGADAVIAALGSGKAIKDARKSMDKAKKEYKDAIKKLNDIERSATKAANKDGATQNDKDNMASAVRAIDIMKQVLTASQVARSVILSGAHARQIQARMFAQAYIAAANKANPKYKGFQKESTEYGFLSNLELL